MACVTRSVISVATSSRSLSFKTPNQNRKSCRVYASKFRIRASADDAEDCNVEDCAPDKEVGTVSMEWLAGEKTRVVGTFPPKRWSGYVEKDTAGQTNIYSVEPTVYVAESAISSGTAGSSSDGAENTAAVVFGLALISVAAASSVLLQVGKNPSQVQTPPYSGPSLNYYIEKFNPPAIIQASAPAPIESSSPTASESSIESQMSVQEAPEASVVSETPVEPPTTEVENAS